MLGERNTIPGLRLNETLASLRDVGKSFSGVRVLDGIDLDVLPGEAHVVAGENGAGKSTLMNILSGVYSSYDGEIRMSGRKTTFRSSADAARSGITMIHQEMSIIPELSVLDNMFLGREKTIAGAWLDRRSQEELARPILAKLGMQIELHRMAGSYPVSVRQVVEIAKAMMFDARIIIMDEPTSALNRPEIEKLFAVIADLKRSGQGIIFISHKMDEIYEVADRITVLRDGKKVGTAHRENLDRNRLITWMVGRELTQQFPRRPRPPTKGRRFAVDGFTVRGGQGYRCRIVDDVSFSVDAGEVLGIAGLEGSGNHELLHALFGYYGHPVSGSVTVDDHQFVPGHPREAVRKGMALLTNDRKARGLVLEMSVAHNITLASLRRFCAGPWVKPAAEDRAAREMAGSLNIRASRLSQPVSELSGGNQQKAVLGKWLATGPAVLLLDEPTRGVDVGAKHEIYRLINRLSREGLATVLITSELPELIAMSDRIIVMHRGKAAAEFKGRHATRETIMAAAMGRLRKGTATT